MTESERRRASDDWENERKMVLAELEHINKEVGNTRTASDSALQAINDLRGDFIRHTVAMEARMNAQEAQTREIDARMARGAAGLLTLGLSFVGVMLKWAWDVLTSGVQPRTH